MPPFSTSRSFQFPTEQNGSFARAMSAIECNAEVGAQGRFNLIVDSEVRGTTIQKLSSIARYEVGLYES